MRPDIENGRRPRRYRQATVRGESATVVTFLVALALLALVALVLYLGIGATLPGI